MSTLNPNVFFELGIRTAANKRVCLVRDDKTPKIPFDINIVNYHTYDPSLSMVTGKEQIGLLAEHIKKVLDAEDANPLWKRFSLTVRAELAAAEPGQDPRMELVLEKMDSIAARMGGIVAPDRHDDAFDRALLYLEQSAAAFGHRPVTIHGRDWERRIIFFYREGSFPPQAIIGALQAEASTLGVDLQVERRPSK